MYDSAASSAARSVLRRRHLLSVKPVLMRLASTSSKQPFPFPLCTNPTPHEVFHLPRSASQDEIKTRYYELVKVYHPDATDRQHDVSPSVRNARFRAVTHAYGVLCGRHGSGSSAWDYYESRDEAMRAELRCRSRRSRSASSRTATAADEMHNGNADDTRLLYTLTAFVLAGMMVAMSSVSSHVDRVERRSKSAAANLTQARAEARAYGMERRRKIREQVEAFHRARETANGSEPPHMHDTARTWPSGPSPGEIVPRERVAR